MSKSDNLPDFVPKKSDKNQKNLNLLNELENYIAKMDFEQVWDFVNRHVLLDDEKDTVFIPDLEEWDTVKKALINSLPKDTYKKFGDLTASLPSDVFYKIKDFFDDELLEKNIFLPKREYLAEIYDKNMGLDKWLVTN